MDWFLYDRDPRHDRVEDLVNLVSFSGMFRWTWFLIEINFRNFGEIGKAYRMDLKMYSNMEVISRKYWCFNRNFGIKGWNFWKLYLSCFFGPWKLFLLNDIGFSMTSSVKVTVWELWCSITFSVPSQLKPAINIEEKLYSVFELFLKY